ncbi:methyltransferase domain-containing protein [Methylomonas sp. EFPC3]|uniref:methyltransferase domain-containing protein n=1 Tax=Methylomonas sp. EFPC3 TaxID=3021710 RepID=UPI0024163454|nr:methyltransferase domain-containing protein [Methylomonas sp. EFPC3]WFP51746.1 methyltransferase domain-containing protein [Methylomonas sp. EFPC3]
MYTENICKDILLFSKAVATNQIARFSPGLYVRLTGQTGRGGDEGSSAEVAGYFFECVEDYRRQLGLEPAEFKTFLAGKTILEYGPGDVLGVALLLYAYGAAQVRCVDRFPLNKINAKNAAIYKALCEGLTGDEKSRAMAAFNSSGDPESGFSAGTVNYAVTPNGLSGESLAYDLIISRAVLEHVDDIDATFADIDAALKPDGKSIHKVDLKSHGLDRYQAFDFLTWPRPLYRLMYSHKGFPNRWRANKYVEAAGKAGLEITQLAPIDQLGAEQIDRIMPKLASEFRSVSRDLFSWLSFWIILEKKPNTY